jgi:hypothetical protein
MPYQKTWTIFGNFSDAPYSACADLNGSSGRASEHPISRGHDFLLLMRKSVIRNSGNSCMPVYRHWVPQRI